MYGVVNCKHVGGDKVLALLVVLFVSRRVY